MCVCVSNICLYCEFVDEKTAAEGARLLAGGFVVEHFESLLSFKILFLKINLWSISP